MANSRLKQYLLRTGLASISTLVLSSVHALPLTTEMTGGGVAFDNRMPTLVVSQTVQYTGIYPIRGGGSAMGETLGFIYNFAGNFSPGDSQLAQGQLLMIGQNTALFSLLGTTYGGDGRTTYGLPDLAGRVTIGAGSGPGLPVQPLGAATGAASVALTSGQLPTHDHALAGGGQTGMTGSNQPFDNMQPSLALRRLIATSGIYPSGGAGAAFLGQVATFAGSFSPAGWAEADGSLLTIVENEALFSILGTTYGGDGRTTFALPDLRGRVSVGVDATHALGFRFGEPITTLTPGQMPTHAHAIAGGSDTGSTGGGTSVNNDQPALALNYLIALHGIFPPRDSGSGFHTELPTLGQIVEFAGNYAPLGWAIANGQLLPISEYEALFALLGTQYGGDGRTTFALPDLRGRTLMGSGDGYLVGERYGSDFVTLTVANLPAHDHALPQGAVPEPATHVLLGFAVFALLGVLRRRPLMRA